VSAGPIQESFEGEKIKIQGRRLRERPLSKPKGQMLPVLIQSTRLYMDIVMFVFGLEARKDEPIVQVLVTDNTTDC